jgi:cytochrome P450
MLFMDRPEDPGRLAQARENRSPVTDARDEAPRTESPTLDGFRLDRRHGRLAFVHACRGVHLAFSELEAALTTALDTTPTLRRDPDAPAPELAGITFRSPAHLHLGCDRRR